jgi:hypothetical protein
MTHLCSVDLSSKRREEESNLRDKVWRLSEKARRD